VEGFWPIFFLMVVLKIPVFFALWLIWWASHPPVPDEAAEDSGGGFEHLRPLPIRPRGPRRGPPQAACRERERSRPIARR